MSLPENRAHSEHETAIRHWNPTYRSHMPFICNVVKGMSRFVLRGMNKLEFEGLDYWEKAFQEKGRGVLSFSNHVSLFDDPLVIANLNRTRFPDLRWIGADHNNFFGNAVKGWIYSAGKVVPLVRGGGLEQPGFEFLSEKLKEGDWVHIFPEGGRTRDPMALLRTTFKRGIGKLLEETSPIAIPFYHYGMHEVLPIGRSMPSLGKTIRVRFGPPIDITDEWLNGFPQADQGERWDAITQWSYTILHQLESQMNPSAATP